MFTTLLSVWALLIGIVFIMLGNGIFWRGRVLGCLGNGFCVGVCLCSVEAASTWAANQSNNTGKD